MEIRLDENYLRGSFLTFFFGLNRRCTTLAFCFSGSGDVISYSCFRLERRGDGSAGLGDFSYFTLGDFCSFDLGDI